MWAGVGGCGRVWEGVGGRRRAWEGMQRMEGACKGLVRGLFTKAKLYLFSSNNTDL